MEPGYRTQLRWWKYLGWEQYPVISACIMKRIGVTEGVLFYEFFLGVEF